MAGTLVANTINTDTGLFSTNNAYLGMAKAWVIFVGSSGSVTNSFNVSSVTRNGTGDYTANFTTAMPNANYCCAGSNINGNSTNNYSLIIGNAAGGATTTTCRFGAIVSSNGSAQDPALVNFMVFGN
jgi:hypothetical protein